MCPNFESGCWATKAHVKHVLEANMHIFTDGVSKGNPAGTRFAADDTSSHQYRISHHSDKTVPDSKVHGADIGSIWGRQDPGGPYVDPMNFAIWGLIFSMEILNT